MKWIILTLLFGWTGCYQFHKGRKGKGFLRLFTIGIFGIGWIKDFFSAIGDVVRASKEKKERKKVKKQIANQLKEMNNQKKEDKPRPPEYLPVIMQDGQIENVETPQIVNDPYCVIKKKGKYYHTFVGCDGWMDGTGDFMMSTIEVEQKKHKLCPECVKTAKYAEFVKHVKAQAALDEDDKYETDDYDEYDSEEDDDI